VVKVRTDKSAKSTTDTEGVGAVELYPVKPTERTSSRKVIPFRRAAVGNGAAALMLFISARREISEAVRKSSGAGERRLGRKGFGAGK